MTAKVVTKVVTALVKQKAPRTGLIQVIVRLAVVWQGQQGSNPRPTVLETVALPTELYPCGAGVPKPLTREWQEGNHLNLTSFTCEAGPIHFGGL